MTKREKMLADAAAAGYAIERKGETTYVVRRQKRTRQILAGIVIWGDGTATRADIDLSLCLSIRTIKAMREQLGI